LRDMGADAELLIERDLPLFADASELTLAHVSRSGREHFLIPTAADSWIRMREAAQSTDVVLVMVSGFRSFERQHELIMDKLAAGDTLDAILSVMAPPGCSEHHTGRAVDVGTPGCSPLSEHFEDTLAFEWLRANAASFGFSLSYPRANRHGYRYEPWHWCHGAV